MHIEKKPGRRAPAAKSPPAGSAPPFPPAVGCSSFKLRQLSRRASQHFDGVLGNAGLKTTQYSLLSHIARLGPVRPGQLAAAMDMDASTLTRNLQPLLAQGWVALGPGEDGRSRLVSATGAGRAKHAQAQRDWKTAQQAFNAKLGDGLVSRLHAVIDECLAAMNAAGDDGEGAGA